MPQVRSVHFESSPVTFEERPDGTVYVTPTTRLGSYPDRLTDRLDHWAEQAPDRTFIAERNNDDSWRELTYAQTRSLVRSTAQALIDRELNGERPVAILSGNDIEHALLGLAAQYAGVPYAPPVTEVKALLSQGGPVHVKPG